MSRILVTGASGFIGRYFVKSSVQCGHEVFASSRSKVTFGKLKLNELVHPSIESLINSCDFPKSLDCVIHLAGLAHITSDKHSMPLTEYRKVNRDATIALAKKCEQLKVKRFIFVSSIGVGGFFKGRQLSENDVANPVEDYAISKLEAENALLDLFENSSVELIIVRPPMVYGPNAPGNFSKLVNIVKSGMPLPIREIDNKRSFIGIHNLVDFLECCICFPSNSAVRNQVYYVSDGEDLSTKNFIKKIARALKRNSRCFWLPKVVIEFMVKILRRQKQFDKAFGSLTVDLSKSRKWLGWEPKYSVSQQLDLIFEENLNDK